MKLKSGEDLKGEIKEESKEFTAMDALSSQAE